MAGQTPIGSSFPLAVPATDATGTQLRRPIAAMILGCAGTTLTVEEQKFFADTNPLGLILFKRNCEEPKQIRSLIAAFRETVGRPDAPILIDQEGGRVARLVPPHWRAYPAAGSVAALYAQDAEAGRRAAYLCGRLIGDDLQDLGITIDCAPVADLRIDGAHEIVGDRSYGATVQDAVILCGAVAAGLLDSGVLPIIKHIPGHGRACVDSHLDLPIVDTDLLKLDETDFAVFRGLRDVPWAMTAHIRYTALDDQLPCTLSETVIAEIIRERIGFDGVLVSDDLSMKALGGEMQSRAEDAIKAGCDIALHCNGDMKEMVAVAAGTPHITKTTFARLKSAETQRLQALGPVPDRAAFDQELESLLAPNQAMA